MKKTFLLLLATSYLFSSPISEPTKKFDGTGGWWFYEEEIKNPETQEVKVVSYKVSPAEKAKMDAQNRTNELLKELIKEQKETKKLTAIVAERMMYAYPNVAPKWTTNSKTGKKCLTNSSADCFVMPVITEAQNFPALEIFLRNPSPENSKNWLQVQAKYFNQINKVSNGLRFAYLKDGDEAYPVNTTYSYGDSLSDPDSKNMRIAKEEKMIIGMKENIAYLFFVGDNKKFESTMSILRNIDTLDSGYMRSMNKVLVFKKESDIKVLETRIQEYYIKVRGNKSIKKAWESLKKVIRPDLFKQNKIRITPTVVLYYNDKRVEKPIYQKIKVGSLSINSVRNATMRFLEYNGILKSSDRSAEKNWAVIEDNHSNNVVPNIGLPEKFKNKNNEVKNEK